MHKRDKGSMIFGMGLGVVVTVAVIFVVYIIQRQSYINDNNHLRDMVSELYTQIYLLENAPAQEISTTPPPTTPPTTPNEAIEAEPGTETNEPNEPETTPTTPAATTAEMAADGRVRVHIPAGAFASDIAQMLYNAGVVTDLNAFINYLVDNNFTVSLMAGDFLLPLDGDFEAIMGQILAGNP